ncbi:MAG: hypothetical protein GBAus27B_000229 [Mycoplasmataceae bacterium]|nr:MAG: hypothetical protein GBAus27B_000229 [Mycoplasmataceae bacterium]
MKKEPIILFSSIGVVGYVVFHGHRQGKDCWLCKYRGLAFLSGTIGLGVFLAIADDD